MEQNETAKVFISYSWGSQDNQKKVLDLAKSLRMDGVDVKLDKWDLKTGQDKFEFMESMVSSPDISRVIIITDKEYAEKANSRTGGVGTETQIITPELYSKENNTKFIPVVFEKDEKGNAYLPIFLKSRIYIDLSEDGIAYEKEYQSLLRDVYELPEEVKPPLGKMPSFLKEDSIDAFKFTRYVKMIKEAAVNRPERVFYLCSQYLNEVVDSSEDFIVKLDGERDLDIQTIDKIRDLLPIRESYTEILKSLLQMDNFDVELIIDFFEDLTNERISNEIEVLEESKLFLIHELFLITVSELIIFKKWKDLSTITNNEYYISRYNQNLNYAIFRSYLDNLEQGKYKKNKKIVGMSYSLLKERTANKRELMQILQADLLLFYIADFKIFDKQLGMHDSWFPETYLLFEQDGPNNLRLFSRLTSRRYVDKLLPIFGTKDVEQFKKFVAEEEYKNGYSELSFHGLPRLERLIQVDKIASKD